MTRVYAIWRNKMRRANEVPLGGRNLHMIQRLLQVGDDVRDIFGADR